MTEDEIERPEWISEDVRLSYRGDELWGRDDHGEFPIDPPRGTDKPREDRCGAVLKYTHERYGETRFCGGMPEKTFVSDGSEFCKHHKAREALMERHMELIEHGAFAQNYLVFAKALDPMKFVFAVEMFGGLLDMSSYDFEVEHAVRHIETDDSELVEEDEIEVGLPVPQRTDLSFQASELWQAALDEVKMQNMQEVIFTDGLSQETIAKSADMEGHITDTVTEDTEHHLHLPLSRVTKDIKNHLRNGGIDTDDDEGGVLTFQQNDYTLTVEPQGNDSDGTEADSDASEDVASDFHTELMGDDHGDDNV